MIENYIISENYFLNETEESNHINDINNLLDQENEIDNGNINNGINKLPKILGQIAEADEKEDLLITDIDLTEIKKIREELPLLKNKREDLYEIIEK